jgi:ADP-heptose:LPS heptosyltransferase
MAEPIDLPKSPYMLIVSGASNAHGGRKKWPQKQYAEICGRLVTAGITPVLIGSKNDNLSELIALCADKAVNLIGATNLYQLITLGMNAVGAVGNDTGPQLIIAASSCPTLTLFSEINPPEKGGAWPWDARHKNLLTADLTKLNVDAVWAALKIN